MYRLHNYYVSEWYYSLEEIAKYLYPALSDDAYSDNFKTIFYTKFTNAPLWDSSNNPKAHLSDLWKLVYARFKDHFCYKSDIEVIQDKDAYNFMLKVVNVIVMTYDKYAKILDIYDSNKSKLMDRVKTTSTSKNKFNDTPQNEDNGSFEDDDHVTNINMANAETETDANTIMGRIKEINDSYQNILLQWANEFDKLFIEEGNV